MDLSEDEDNNKHDHDYVIISGILKDGNWRAGRGDVRESMDLLRIIEEPIPEHQKEIRNCRTVKYHLSKPTSNTFEDIHGIYASLGKKALSLVSSCIDVEEWFKKRNKEFRTASLLYHPDKNIVNLTQIR